MTRVSIHSLELTPLEAEVLSEILAAKLEEHIANRAKYMRKDSDGAIQASDQRQGGSSPVSANLPPSGFAFSLASEEEQAGREAIVAWDLTLRCPRCNSGVEGNARKYHCHSCERKGR